MMMLHQMNKSLNSIEEKKQTEIINDDEILINRSSARQKRRNSDTYSFFPGVSE